jgi:hypothetical protein
MFSFDKNSPAEESGLHTLVYCIPPNRSPSVLFYRTTPFSYIMTLQVTGKGQVDKLNPVLLSKTEIQWLLGKIKVSKTI